MVHKKVYERPTLEKIMNVRIVGPISESEDKSYNLNEFERFRVEENRKDSKGIYKVEVCGFPLAMAESVIEEIMGEIKSGMERGEMEFIRGYHHFENKPIGENYIKILVAAPQEYFDPEPEIYVPMIPKETDSKHPRENYAPSP